MMLTEEEAKTKWCPYGAGAPTMVSLTKDGAAEYLPVPKERARCIASQCMAWRWNPSDIQREQWIAAGAVHLEKRERQGFCGIAGKIEQ